jgi:UPF0716 protein FxsA
MTMVLPIVLIAVPLVEIAVMIKVGHWIGFWPSFAIVVATFMLGASVLAHSGLTAAFRVQEAFVRGEPPVAAMLEGALMVASGLLLATPGFLADCAGLALLIPPVRAFAADWLARRMSLHVVIDPGGRRGTGFDPGPGHDDGPRSGGPPRQPEGGGPVIEGEFERLDERPVGGADRGAGSGRKRHGEADPP